MSGEALIRNLFLASTIMRELKARVQPIAYLPGIYTEGFIVKVLV